MINTKEIQSRFKSLLGTFDKSYLEELFEEGDKCGFFPTGNRQNIKYDYKGWTYVVSRHEPLPQENEIIKRVNL